MTDEYFTFEWHGETYTMKSSLPQSNRDRIELVVAWFTSGFIGIDSLAEHIEGVLSSRLK